MFAEVCIFVVAAAAVVVAAVVAASVGRTSVVDCADAANEILGP